MKARRLDRTRPYATVYGERDYRYQQDGESFRSDGSWVIPAHIDAALVEDDEAPPPIDLVPRSHYETTEAYDEAMLRALCKIYQVVYFHGITEADIWAKMPVTGDFGDDE